MARNNVKQREKMKKILFLISVLMLGMYIQPVLFGRDRRTPGRPHDVVASRNNEQATEDIYNEFEVFIKVVKAIQDKYVDEIDLNTILTNAYRGMLSELDPFSQYFSAEELTDLKIETEGEFEGLGIEVSVKEGLLTVITPLLDSPAFKAGVLIGDKILKVDGKLIKNMSIRDAVKILRGKLGTETTLTVLHEGETKPVEITIKREKIHVNSIRGARMVEEEYKIGYFAVTNFQDNTIKDMEAAVEDLLKKGMKSLVMDLRFNPGGVLSAAVEMVDKFLEKGIIVSTKGREHLQNFVYHARKKGTYPDFPLVVLVNNGSASASEIVAGAIKDHKRGILLGIKTYGKGSVQSLISVGEGSVALKLTTARYYTPSGICIHDKGVEPDINVPLNYTQIKVLHEHLSQANIDEKIRQTKEGRATGSEEMAIKDAGTEKEGPQYKDIQLERAIDILKGIEIFAKRTISVP
ncbi:MAG: S41 family peptidase [Candidatus Brocadiaceae bacterium]|nr:S41 family peptidase [Candidatus Brocadiaceae bacterium]